MKLAVNNQSLDSLRILIKERFADFNRGSSPSRGRKYPVELRELVCQGSLTGIPPGDLEKLSGMSSTAVKRAMALKASRHPGSARPKPEAPRRLEVVGAVAAGRQPASAVMIRLPSGVTIDLGDPSGLTTALLGTLAYLEAPHVASR
jgi:hypothetical protein